MHKIKLITLLCLLAQGCTSVQHKESAPINDLDSIILAPQQDHVFDNSASQPIDPNTVIQDNVSETPQPTLDDVKPTRSYWF